MLVSRSAHNPEDALSSSAHVVVILNNGLEQDHDCDVQKRAEFSSAGASIIGRPSERIDDSGNSRHNLTDSRILNTQRNQVIET